MKLMRGRPFNPGLPLLALSILSTGCSVVKQVESHDKPSYRARVAVAGWCNALTAIVGAFWCAFPMRLIAEVFTNRLRTNPRVQAFLSGIVPAVLGMSAAAAASLARSGLDSMLSFGVATTAFLLMLRARLNPVVILIGCGGLQFAVAHYLY